MTGGEEKEEKSYFLAKVEEARGAGAATDGG